MVMLLIVTSREDCLIPAVRVQSPMVKVDLQIDVEYMRYGHKQYREWRSVLRIVDHFLRPDFSPGMQQFFGFVVRLV